ncbi:MAG: ABC transporter substrate-binding protein, partial [Candidatus Omnitrophota bacterium]
INTWAGYAHAYIAQEKGYFEKNGARVELVFFKDYASSRQCYIDGEAEGVFEVYADAILQNSEGIPSRVVYAVDYSVSADVIIGKPELNDLSDLRGKKVGIEGINTFSHLFVLMSLEKSGLKEQEMRFEIVPALDVPEALEKGIIEAGHTWEPAKTEAIKKGYKVLSDAQYLQCLITDVLVFSDQVIKQRPQEIKGIIKALFEAREFLRNNRQEAVRIMAKYEGMSEAEMEEGLGGVELLDLKGNIKAMHKSADISSLYVSGEIIANFYLARGQLPYMPDLDKIIDSKFIKE